MGVVDGTMVKMYDMSAQIDRYSDLSDKIKSGTANPDERKEMRTLRRRLTV